MTVSKLQFAACQFPVSGAMTQNLSYIFRYMRRAADHSVDIIHFPEVALPGAVGLDFSSFEDLDWNQLQRHTNKIQELARRLKIWVVLGSYDWVSAHAKPTNSLHIIADTGDIVANYDKQRLFGKESERCSAGNKPVTLTIKGVRCGFLICYDSCFPSLYQGYRRMGIQLLFHSYYNARNEGGANSLDDLMVAQLRTRAADHGLWISASNSSARHSRMAACVARPDGHVRTTKRHMAGFAVGAFPGEPLGWTYDNGEG